MSTATISPVLRTGTRPVRPEVRRPVQQPTPGRGPVARPVRPVPAPSLRSGQRSSARSCRVDVAAPASSWRLTDRGIALVLVLVVMVTVAAVAVIGLTAWRVTGADYQPAGSAVGALVSSR